MWKLFWIYHRLSFGRTHIMHITVSSTSCIFFVPYIDFVKAVESNWNTRARAQREMHQCTRLACVGVLRGQTTMRSERDRIARPIVGNVAIVGTNSESGLFVVIYWLVCRTWKNRNTKRHSAAARLPRALRYLHATTHCWDALTRWHTATDFIASRELCQLISYIDFAVRAQCEFRTNKNVFTRMLNAKRNTKLS